MRTVLYSGKDRADFPRRWVSRTQNYINGHKLSIGKVYWQKNVKITNEILKQNKGK
jgi:hypothetical protein